MLIEFYWILSGCECNSWLCVSAVFLHIQLCPYTSAQWLVLHNQTWRSHHVIIVPMELSAL